MSRYVFVAAVAIFAGLSLVLAFSLAQRDARISHTLRDESTPPYAAQLASPISVQKAALEDETSASLPRLDAMPPSTGIQLATHNFPTEIEDPPAVGSPKPLVAPPRFDASRIVAKRADSGSEPKLTSREPPLGNPPSGPAYVQAAGPATLPPPPMLPSSSQRSIAGPEATPPLATPPLASATLGAPLPPPDSDAPAPFSPLPSPSPFPSPLPSTSPLPSPLPSTSPSPLPSTSPSPLPSTSPSPLPSTSPSPSARSVAPSNPAPPISPTGVPKPFPAPTAVPSMPDVSVPKDLASPPSNLGYPPARVDNPPKNIGSTATSRSAGSASSTSRSAWSKSSGSPGARQFDGSQNPSLEIIKRAPSEVQVGVPATFTAIVRNVGNATAFDVEVFDTVPQGAKLVRTTPQAENEGPDGLVWKLGELAAGRETTISMELIPESEGELGSVASVKFAAQASVRTISTLPKLSIKQWAPGEILGGDTLTIRIEVSNVGTGTAKGVELEEDVPPALRHASGARSLGLEVGDLAPGESHRYEIELTAIEAAKATNILRATARNAATSESSQPIEVRAPKLQLQVKGPRIRYLERPAPFEAVIENVGTAVARDLYIVAYLPRGLHFSSANNQGTYLPEQHAIAWNLAELAAGTRAKTEFIVLPVEEGKSLVRMTTDAEGLKAEAIEREVQVEGQSELTFDIEDDHDPIEREGITTYTIHLTNIGTRPDQNVVLALELAEGSTVEQIDAPMKHRVQGRTVIFESIGRLPPKDRVAVKVSVRHGREGTQVFRASVQSDLRPVAVIKEESTQVYIDR